MFNAFFVIRVLILFMSLSAFYCLWTSTHLVKKSLAWLVFQTGIVWLWLSGSYSYHGRDNPLPQVAAFLIFVFSIGILGIMLIFALGVSRREGSWDIEKANSEKSS